MTRRQTTLVAMLLFVLAVLLRLPHLGAFLTPDEQRIWTTLTAEFMSALLRGDWAATATSGYPGVTTTWAGSVGLALQWLIARPPDVTSLAGMADALLASPSRLDMLPWVRLGVVLASAAGIALVFLLTRRVFDDTVALFAAGLMVFDPFLLAHTRILNTDPLLALALTISWLALMIGATGGQRRYLVISGIGFGLALLTKTPALLVTPLVIGWIFWQQGHRQSSAGDVLRAGAIDLAWFAVPAALTCLVLWPALWVAPLATLQRSIEFAAVLGQTGHELGNFWLGQPVEGPGALFYPAVLLWRSTPVTLIGLVLAILALTASALGRLRSATPKNGQESRSAAWALVLFVAWFAVAMSLSPKKFDRYLLPAFPAVDILAAWGWLTAVRWISVAWRRRAASRQTTQAPRFGGRPQGVRMPASGTGWAIVAMLVLVSLQAASAFSHLPTYLTAYNPLLGGLRTAERVMLVGWGEGLEQAAAYLDQPPDASTLRVAAWYGSNVFGPFFHGRSYDLHYDLRTAADLYANDVDYVVTYINQLQRQLLDASIAGRLGTPLMTSSWSGVPLAQVYAWPKPFEHTSDRSLADGLQLLGWELGQVDPNQSQVPVRLYWDADVAAAGGLPPVLVWLKDASGEVWAKTEIIPTVDPALLTGSWTDRQAAPQTFTLHLPAGLHVGEYRVEMAPQATASLDLGAVAIAASLDDQIIPQDVQAPPEPVVFGNSVQLVGSDLVVEGDIWQLDLLWAALASPPPKAKFFVHGIDSAGEIVAQVDSVLAALPGQEIAGWQQGELVRQRVQIEWPTDTGDSRSLYLGIYDPDTGQRLPVAAGGQILPDGRYPLAR